MLHPKTRSDEPRSVSPITPTLTPTSPPGDVPHLYDVRGTAEMGRLLGAVLLAGIMTMGSALAQNPMSPVYPTGPAKPRPARPPVEEIAEPDHEPSTPPPAAQASPAEEGPVATAVIPPPVEKAPAMSAEPNKPATAEAKPEATEPHQAVKHHRRRRTHYARRLYVPYPVGWYHDNAGTRGW